MVTQLKVWAATLGSRPGVPNFRDLLPDDPSGAGVGIIEVKCTVNGMQLNHPETILLTLVHRKIVFHKIGLRCQKNFFFFFCRFRPQKSPGEGHGNPLQYSCLENPFDRGAWGATVHGVAKSQTRLSSQALSIDHTKIPPAKCQKHKSPPRLGTQTPQSPEWILASRV